MPDNIKSSRNARKHSRLQAASTVTSNAIGAFSETAKIPVKIAQFSAGVYSLFYNNTNRFEKLNTLMQCGLLGAHLGLLFYMNATDSHDSSKTALNLLELAYSGILVASFGIYETMRQTDESNHSPIAPAVELQPVGNLSAGGRRPQDIQAQLDAQEKGELEIAMGGGYS